MWVCQCNWHTGAVASQSRPVGAIITSTNKSYAKISETSPFTVPSSAHPTSGSRTPDNSSSKAIKLPAIRKHEDTPSNPGGVYGSVANSNAKDTSSGNLETSSRTVESAGKDAISSDSMDSKLKNSSASKMERKSFVLKTKDHPMLKPYVQLLTCHCTSLLSLAHACTHM